MTINGKNYRNARRRSYSYYGKGKRWRRNKYTMMHARSRAKLR